MGISKYKGKKTFKVNVFVAFHHILKDFRKKRPLLSKKLYITQNNKKNEDREAKKKDDWENLGGKTWRHLMPGYFYLYVSSLWGNCTFLLTLTWIGPEVFIYVVTNSNILWITMKSIDVSCNKQVNGCNYFCLTRMPPRTLSSWYPCLLISHDPALEIGFAQRLDLCVPVKGEWVNHPSSPGTNPSWCNLSTRYHP